MKKNVAELQATAKALSSKMDENFLELGHTLRQLQDHDPAEFSSAVSGPTLGLRKAYVLVSIDRAFSKIPVPKDRLKKIGWTKLNMLVPHVDKANYAELIKKAEQHTAVDLGEILAGREPGKKPHVMNLRFSTEQYDALVAALLKNGATKPTKGKGLVDKEEALINIVQKLG